MVSIKIHLVIAAAPYEALMKKTENVAVKNCVRKPEKIWLWISTLWITATDYDINDNTGIRNILGYQKENTHTHTHKTEGEGTLSNSFYEPSFTPVPAKDIKREENYRTIFTTNIDARIFNNVLANQAQQHIKRLYTTSKWDLSQECENGSP